MPNTPSRKAAVTKIQAISIVVIIIVAAVAASYFLFLAPPAAPKATELVVATWGGLEGDTFTRYIFAKFEEETGAKVVPRFFEFSGQGLAWLRAEKDDPQIDIYYSTYLNGLRCAREGLSVPLDADKIPSLQDNIIYANLPEKSMHDGQLYMPVFQAARYGLIYRPDLAPFPVDRLGLFFDPALKGRTGIPYIFFGDGASLLGFTLLRGANEYNNEPGWQALKELAPSLLMVYTSTGAAREALVRGDLWAAYGLPTSYLGAEDVLKWVMPQDIPAVIEANPINVIKNGPNNRLDNYELAHKFVNVAVGPEGSLAYANLGFTPANVKTQIPSATRPITGSPEDVLQGYLQDYEIVYRDIGQWLDRWEEEIVPLVGG